MKRLFHSGEGLFHWFPLTVIMGGQTDCGLKPAMHHNSQPRSSTFPVPPPGWSRGELFRKKSEMKCQERSDCLGKGDPN